jgi:hypothetical protein
MVLWKVDASWKLEQQYSIRKSMINKKNPTIDTHEPSKKL